MHRFILVLMSLLILGCSDKDQMQQEELKQKEQRKVRFSEMVSKHNIDKYCMQFLAETDSLGFPVRFTTLQLQEAFASVESSGHTVLFVVVFDDLVKQENQYIAYFIGHPSLRDTDGEDNLMFYLLDPPKFYLELSCKEEQAKVLLRTERDWSVSNLAIVAKVNNVRKSSLKLDCVTSGEDEAYIELESSHMFFIRGELLDFCQLWEGFSLEM